MKKKSLPEAITSKNYSEGFFRIWQGFLAVCLIIAVGAWWIESDLFGEFINQKKCEDMVFSYLSYERTKGEYEYNNKPLPPGIYLTGNENPFIKYAGCGRMYKTYIGKAWDEITTLGQNIGIAFLVAIGFLYFGKWCKWVGKGFSKPKSP